jgi:signal transduction histidine kinase
MTQKIFEKGIIFLILFFNYFICLSQGNSWKEVKKNGSGQLTVIYSENSPFIYKNSRGQLEGIEYHMIANFIEYLNDIHNLDVQIEWTYVDSFEVLYDSLKLSTEPILGIASLSITDSRKREILFSDPYLPDIEIIVSSNNLPVASNIKEFSQIVKSKRSISVARSTFEQNLVALKENYFPGIFINYVPNVDILIDSISNSKDLWGYISLPNYLAYYRNNKKIKRQRFFMVENEGLAIAGSMSSDWIVPFNEYLKTSKFKILMPLLIDEYLGNTFKSVVWSISEHITDSLSDNVANREVGVLTLEREFQDLKIKQNELELKNKNLFIILAIICIILILVALLAVFRTMRLKSESNKKLLDKNEYIEAQYQELKILNKEKNDLISIVAHDLKNPLTSAISVTDTFKDEEDVSENQKEYLYLIAKCLERMRILIEKILEIKMLESKELDLQIKRTNIKSIVEQVIEELTIQSEKKNIAISKDLRDISIEVDPNYTFEIIENLISNAIKFSHPGSNITVTISEQENHVEVKITDEGPGLTHEDKEKLFGKFQKLSAKPTGGETSTGLGLSIVKKYVDAMKGNVRCESEQGKGASFIVGFKKYF